MDQNPIVAAVAKHVDAAIADGRVEEVEAKIFYSVLARLTTPEFITDIDNAIFDISLEEGNESDVRTTTREGIDNDGLTEDQANMALNER